MENFQKLSLTEKKTRPQGRPRPSMNERMMQGKGSLIRRIHCRNTSGTPPAACEDTVTIKNYEFIASYSWKDIEHPTIYVPGLPPRVITPNLPTQLQKDNLTRSKVRSPAAAVDPLFETLLHQCPDFDMSTIDLVSDRNSLRKFLSFASQASDKWRIEVDMINETLFFNQWEEFRLMMINGHQDSGYGHAFEDCFTVRESPLEDTIHHERIVKYEIGGLKCMVRFEADAYLDAGTNDESDGGVSIISSDPPAPKPSKPVLRPPYKLVHVVSRGHSVDADLIVEIKSCSTSKFSISKTLPQLWFAQTKHLGVGYHINGLVTKQLDMRDMSEELRRWEESNQGSLRNMIRIIMEIREIAKSVRKCTVVCTVVDGVKCLSVYHRRGSDMVVRPHVVQRFWRNSGRSHIA